MKKGKLTLKIIFLLLLSDVFETLLNYCFKKGVGEESNLVITGFKEALVFVKAAAGSPYLWLAMLIAFLMFVMWSAALSKIDLSVAILIASTSYILVPIVSIMFLHEKVSILRWIGIFVIMAGIVFVSATHNSKEGIA
jgi:drug/metabolite transporter (DMT)-like permease